MTATDILGSCKACGKSHKFNKLQTNIYCSMDCYRLAQRSGDYKRGPGPSIPRYACAQCGIQVTRALSKRRNGEQANHIFCGRDCYDAFRVIAAKIRSKALTKRCERCDKKFVTETGNAKYCCMDCRLAEKKAKPTNCINCGCLFTAIYLQPKTGKFISKNGVKTCSSSCHLGWMRNNEDRKNKISATLSGDKHPNWQGGMAHQSLGYRGTNWQKQRVKAMRRDKQKCVDCGISNADCLEKYGRSLDVDHITPFHNFSSHLKANVLSNLECRCSSCHRIEEAKRSMCQMVLPLNGKKHHQHRGQVRGEAVNTARLTEQKVLEIRRFAKGGACGKDIAERFGITKSNAHQVISGRTWKHLLPFVI